MTRVGVALLLPLLCGAAEFDVVDGVVWSNPQPGVELKADLYLPKGEGAFPAVVFIHGGGWVGRNRKQLHRQAEHMASLGVAGFAIEYRIASEATYPAALDDARAAVRWVRANAAKYRVDSRRIGAAGSSAGGHLAALLGVTHARGADVSVVVAFNPVLDLTDMARNSSSTTKFMGGPCTEKVEACREASPVFHASAQAAPMLILHGTADENVPYHQAEEMARRLKAAGATVELFTAPGAKHTFWGTKEWYAPTDKAMETFLLRYLR